MAFDDFEQSQDDGQPVELYRFSMGGDIILLQTTNLESVEPTTGEVYEPAAIVRSGIEKSSDLAADGSLTILVPPTHLIAAMLVLVTPVEPIFLEIIAYHREDPDQEQEGIWSGFVRSASLGQTGSTLHCTPIPGGLNREGLAIGYQRTCPYQLYDADTCKVDRDDFTLEGEILTLDGITITAAVFDTMPDGWLDSGFARVGDEIRLVTSHLGDTITVLFPFSDASVGGEILGEAGCDRLKPTCKDKFNNLPNMGGAPWMPDKNPFQVGIEG